MDRIHKNVKNLRLQKGMTLKEVAKLLSVTEATAQRYESGKGIKDIPYDKIIRYAEIFDVEPAYLISGEETLKEKTTLPEFDKDHLELITLYSKLSDEQKQSVLNLMRSMV